MQADLCAANCRTLLLTLAILGSACAADLIAADARGDSASAPQDAMWRTSVRCGLNSAYVYLRLKGYRLDYEQVAAAIPLSDKGSSLEDLRSFIILHDPATAVVRTTPAALKGLQLPFIAHLEEDTTTIFNSVDSGHYVVVVRITAESVTFIDGTSGIIRSMRSDLFYRAWSGYLILTDQRIPYTKFLILAICIAFAFGWILSDRIQKNAS